MSESAADRVRAALAVRQPVKRRDLEHALREALGMSARQAKSFVAQGAKALGATDDDRIAEMIEFVDQLKRTIRT